MVKTWLERYTNGTAAAFLTAVDRGETLVFARKDFETVSEGKDFAKTVKTLEVHEQVIAFGPGPKREKSLWVYREGTRA
jgi:hypothetical protein